MTVTKPIYNLFNTGILTKLCVAGSTSVDTDDPADVQCELAGDVTAMMWIDENTLLIYELERGLREAKFGMPIDMYLLMSS